MPKRRIYPRGRPQRPQRLCWRTANFGTSKDLLTNDFLAINDFLQFVLLFAKRHAQQAQYLKILFLVTIFENE